MKHKKTTKT